VNFAFAQETVWLTQTQIVRLFETIIDTVGHHLMNICNESELEESSTTKDISVVRSEGNNKVKR